MAIEWKNIGRYADKALDVANDIILRIIGM